MWAKHFFGFKIVIFRIFKTGIREKNAIFDRNTVTSKNLSTKHKSFKFLRIFDFSFLPLKSSEKWRRKLWSMTIFDKLKIAKITHQK